MQYLVKTNYRSCSVEVKIQANRSCVIWLEAYDPNQSNTYYIKRFKNLAPSETVTLCVQMPIVGKRVMVNVYDNSDTTGSSFTVKEVKQCSLPRNLRVANIRDCGVREFVRFAQQFCFNCGVLPTYTNRYYKSSKCNFLIEYLQLIVGDDGNEELTPARINISSKIIQVSKAKYAPMTIPRRLCILFHEYSHMFRNEDMYNELEADLNALIIYLGLGYPRIEAKETFLSIFEQSGGEDNYKRYHYIEDFIDRYEHLNFSHL